MNSRRIAHAPHSGFTLVEIAIVLVIIGLLLGSVLKGQELITQAKIKNVSNELNGFSAAVYSYQERFRALPGDDPGAHTRWTDTDAAGANPGNGIMDADEQLLFWQHLRKAGFVAGKIKAGPALNAVGGKTEPVTQGHGLGGIAICTHRLPAKIAEALDVQFDEGSPSEGSIRSAIEVDTVPTTTPTITNYVDDGNTLYLTCKLL